MNKDYYIESAATTTNISLSQNSILFFANSQDEKSGGSIIAAECYDRLLKQTN